MERLHQKANRLKKERISEVYVPKWAQTLIDLYTSPLKYEILGEMKTKEFFDK